MNSNSGYTTPGPDPLNALPGQSGYETGDSSVTPLNPANQQNFNFAIARVRLQDAALASAQNVRVFFRLFVAQSCDTDFQPTTTYKSTLGTTGDDNGKPIFPLPSGTGFDGPVRTEYSNDPVLRHRCERYARLRFNQSQRQHQDDHDSNGSGQGLGLLRMLSRCLRWQQSVEVSWDTPLHRRGNRIR